MGNMKDNKPIAFYVPSNLNPALIPKGQWQYAAYLLNLIHWKWICWRADKDGYVFLKTKYLCRVIPRTMWVSLRHTLSELGVIETDGKIRFGSPQAKCRGFRLASNYRQAKRIECTDTAIIRKIRKLKQQAHLPVHRWLESKLELIDFDKEKAESIISTMYPKAGSPLDDEEYRQLITQQCNKFTDKELRLTIDRFGRVHTPLTSLPNELRSCLSVYGETLVNIDLANSQPLFAGLVATNYYRNRTARQRFCERTFPEDVNPYHKRSITTAEVERPDLTRYLEVCQAGQLYGSVMQPGDQKDKIKRAWLIMMYGRNHLRSQLKAQFENQYPSVAAMLKDLKRKNYRHAAHLMQNVESTMMIYGICRRLMKESPTLPVYTIHDSYLTLASKVELVTDTIRQEFNLIGMSPKLTVKDC